MKTNSPKIVLILTACIDPSNSKNRWLVLTDAKTRFLQYKDALEFYYLETKCPIIFIDNSGYDVTELEEKYRGGRVEILSFISSPEVRSKGKGFGEQDIIRQAVMSSSHLKDADYIIKITGRIKVLSINYLINLIIKKSAKKKKWVIAEKLFNGHWIHSYCFAAHKDFFDAKFFNEMQKLSEIEGKEYAFEQSLYKLVIEWTKSNYFFHVLFPIQVNGYCGGLGHSYKRNSIKDYIKCFIEAFKINMIHSL